MIYLRYVHSRKKKLWLVVILWVFVAAYLYVKLFLPQKHETKWAPHLKLTKDQKSYMDRRGVQVIIGHYFGGAPASNLTPEIINANNFNPEPSAGYNGKPVELTSKEISHARQLFSLHGFNIVASDKIPLDRQLLDVRHPKCIEQEIVMKSLPSASVIIIFHNEAWSTLLRTVTSVLMRSPPELLYEVLLVDDASNRDYLKKPLEQEVEKLEKVKLHRLNERSGLVKARLVGANAAKADVILFLDAHVEVTTGWLPPLLVEAKKGRFASPVIDTINDDTFSYTRSLEPQWGTFSRRLHFRWLYPSIDTMRKLASNPHEPYAMPVMAGGLFAVKRDLFWKLGGYDEEMSIWGGENLEISWRAWLCGASIYSVPCSRAGHVFRKSSPYTFLKGVNEVLGTNLARATIWTGRWRNFFLKYNIDAGNAREKADRNITERKALMTKLHCRDFSWYLRNIWPDHFFPDDDRWYGKMKNLQDGKCLSGVSGIGGKATLIDCAAMDALFVFANGLIMFDEGLCLDVNANASKEARLSSCSGVKRQHWLKNGSHLVHSASFKCLLNGENSLNLDICSSTAVQQKWIYEEESWE